MAASGRDIRAGGAYVEVYAKGAEATRAKLAAFASSMSSLGNKFLGAGAALAAPLLLSVKQYADAASRIKDASDRTGVAIETIQELKYAAEQSGASFEDLEIGIKKMQQAIAQGKIGDAALKMLPVGEQFAAVLKQIGAIEDPARRTATAIEVFGRSGTKLLPMARNLDQVIDAFNRLGIKMSKDDVEAGEALGDSLADLGKIAKAAAAAIGAALGPAIQDITGWITANSGHMLNWIKQHRELVTVVGELALGFLGFGIACKGVAVALWAVAAGIKGVEAAAAASKWLWGAMGKLGVAGGIGVGWGASMFSMFSGLAEEGAAAYNAVNGPGKQGPKPWRAETAPVHVQTEFEKKLDEERHRLRIAMIEDEYERESALLKDLLAKDLETARETDSDQMQVIETHNLRAAALDQKQAKARKEEDYKNAEEVRRDREAKAKDEAALRTDLQDEAARQRIENTMTGSQKERALIDLEHDQALRDMQQRGFGQDTKQDIEELFRLRRAGVREHERYSVAGTFSPFAAAGMGMGRSPAQEQLAEQKKSNKELAEIKRNTRDRLKFAKS